MHCAVVDPGVGSTRRILAAKVDDHYFVGPDNGIFHHVLCDQMNAAVFAVDRHDLYRQPLSQTFHGRDIFAPVAAYLAQGGLIEDLGPRCTDWVRLDLPSCENHNDRLTGSVVHIDSFGNLITNIPANKCPEGTHFVIGDHSVTERINTYSDGKSGTLYALESSNGMIEFTAPLGSAAGVINSEGVRSSGLSGLAGLIVEATFPTR